MRIVLTGLVVLCGLSAFPQDIQLKDVQFRDGYRFSQLNAESFRFIYKIKSRDPQRSLFRKIDFTGELQMLDTTLINLWGDYQLLATTTSSTHTASLFGSRLTSSLLIHFIDNKTEQQLSYPLPVAGPWSPRNFVQLYSHPETDALYFLYKVDAKTWDLQQLDLQGKPVWSKRFTDPNRIQLDNLNLLDDNQVAVVKAIHPGSRKAKNEVVVLDGTTGNETYVHALYNSEFKGTIDNVLVKDSKLYVVGRKFFTNRVSQNETGLPFVLQIESDQASDIKLTSSLLNLKTFWMDVIVAENGDRYLIGETFSNESRGAYIMKGVVTGLMTLGLFYVSWTTMKFEQVAIVPLDHSGAAPLSLVQLAPRKVQLGTYTPGYSFANYAHATGQVRYWGYDGQGHAILADGGLLKRYHITTRQTEELGRLPENSAQTIIHTTEDHIIYLNQSRLNNLIQFKAIPLQK